MIVGKLRNIKEKEAKKKRKKEKRKNETIVLSF